jgi:hypothetical protein
LIFGYDEAGGVYAGTTRKVGGEAEPLDRAAYSN